MKESSRFTCLVQMLPLTSIIQIGLTKTKTRNNSQKQPSRGVPRKRCSEYMQQIYRRRPMPKCDLRVALQLY